MRRHALQAVCSNGRLSGGPWLASMTSLHEGWPGGFRIRRGAGKQQGKSAGFRFSGRAIRCSENPFL